MVSRSRAQVEHLVQGRDALTRVLGAEPRARVELAQLGQRVILDQPAAVGRAIERLVVDDGQLAVAGQMHVELDPVGAELERALERRHRVFRAVAHRAAVADDPDPPALLCSRCLATDQ